MTITCQRHFSPASARLLCVCGFTAAYIWWCRRLGDGLEWVIGGLYNMCASYSCSLYVCWVTMCVLGDVTMGYVSCTCFWCCVFGARPSMLDCIAHIVCSIYTKSMLCGAKGQSFTQRLLDGVCAMCGVLLSCLMRACIVTRLPGFE